MTNKNLIEKFKKLAKRNKAQRKDLRFIRTIALLRAKGLLHTNLPIKPATGLRLDINDVLWAGKNVEPRILEVLPAAILHFRNNFVGTDKLPKELELVIREIQANAEVGPDFEGIPFHKMKYWANMQLRDRRTKPEAEKRRLKAFRLRRHTLDKLKTLVATGKFNDQTSALEAAVAKL